jgi:DNA-binding response OmpR family regulator
VFVHGEEAQLTQREFDVLLFLARHPGQVFSRNQLMDAIWQYSFYTDTSTVTVHIRRLRAKIESDPAQPCHIETVWGVGYRFAP